MYIYINVIYRDIYRYISDFVCMYVYTYIDSCRIIPVVDNTVVQIISGYHHLKSQKQCKYSKK
jgi:hypothetical protein